MCGEESDVRTCAAACPNGGRPCWEGCRGELISHAECATLCGFEGPGSEGACGELCVEYNETPASCQALCNGLDDECGQAACVQLCREEGLTPSECIEACPDFDTPWGVANCYIACLGMVGPDECRALCGGEGTTCGEGGCWQVCPDSTDLTTCAATCGVSTACGQQRCYAQCGRAGMLDFSECRSICGWSDGGCDCGLGGTVAMTCMEFCLSSGETGSTCATICAP
jgi:hypothetical protein